MYKLTGKLSNKSVTLTMPDQCGVSREIYVPSSEEEGFVFQSYNVYIGLFISVLL